MERKLIRNGKLIGILKKNENGRFVIVEDTSTSAVQKPVVSQNTIKPFLKLLQEEVNELKIGDCLKLISKARYVDYARKEVRERVSSSSGAESCCYYDASLKEKIILENPEIEVEGTTISLTSGDSAFAFDLMDLTDFRISMDQWASRGMDESGNPIVSVWFSGDSYDEKKNTSIFYSMNFAIAIVKPS